MGLITKLISHGVSFAAGVAAQRFYSSVEPYSPADEDIWQGKTREMRLSHSDAESLYEEVVGWLNFDWDDFEPDDDQYGVQPEGHSPFMEHDLKSLRLKIEHAQAEADDDEPVIFEVTDRERLLVFDLTFKGPEMRKIRQIGREELSWS